MKSSRVLPTNSAQRLALEKLRLKSANDDARIKTLEAQLAALQPQQGMDVERVWGLKVFFEEDRDLSSKEVSGMTGIQKSKISYHIDELRKLKFVIPFNNMVLIKKERPRQAVVA